MRPTGNRAVTSMFRPFVRVLLACGLICLSGCPGPAADKAQGPLPYQGQTIRVAVPKGWGFKDLWEVQLEEWSARTGAKAELTEVEMTDGSGPLLKGENDPQLLILPWTRRGELLASQQLMAFPQDSLVESKLDWDDLFRGLRERQAQLDVGPGLAPIGAPVLVCYYRADLLEKAGLKPPETWDDYQKLLDQLETWAPGLTAVEPWSPEFRATMFLARAIPFVKGSGQYSIFFSVEDGAPFIASPGFLKGLEMTQAALKKLAPEVLKYDPVACRNQVVTGKSALAIGLENGPVAGGFNLAATTPPAAKDAAAVARADAIAIGFCRLPGATQVYSTTTNAWEPLENQAVNYVTLTGFAGLCAGVPRSAKPEQASAALNLLTALVLDDATPSPSGAKTLCRERQTPDAGNWTGKELSAAEAGKYVAAVGNSLRDRQQASELPVLGHVEFRASLTKGLTSCLENGQSPADALNAVAAEWKELVQKFGVEKILSSYRSALGLSRRESL